MIQIKKAFEMYMQVSCVLRVLHAFFLLGVVLSVINNSWPLSGMLLVVFMIGVIPIVVFSLLELFPHKIDWPGMTTSQGEATSIQLSRGGFAVAFLMIWWDVLRVYFM